MFTTRVLWFFLLTGAGAAAQAPCPPRAAMWQDLEATSARLPNDQLADHCQALRKQCEACRSVRDSVYAKVLHILGRAYMNTGRLREATMYTRAAVRVNSLPVPEAKPANLANSYHNLGRIYRQLNQTVNADASFSQALRVAEKYPEKKALIPLIHLEWAYLFGGTGDFEQAIAHNREGERSARGLGLVTQQLNNTIGRAQALINLSRYAEATSVLVSILALLKIHPDDETLVFVLAMLGQNERRTGHPEAAVGYYRRALTLYERQLASRPVGMTGQEKQTEVRANYGAIANSLAVVYSENLHDFPQALQHYRLAQDYTDDPFVKAYIQGNVAKIFVRQKNFRTALAAYQQALVQAPIGFTDKNIDRNPAPEVMRRAQYKRYLFYLVREKAAAWLAWANHSGQRAHLHSSLATHLVADRMIDYMRWEHTGEGSKKFWRENTHAFYEAAIETCYQLNQPERAFYFFEKSRAALLADRLNELGANQLLNPTHQKRQISLQDTVATLRQRLSALKPGDNLYPGLQQKLLTAEEAQAAFIRNLETQNPAYYRYRYDTTAVTLAKVRQKLLTKGQTLLEYFVGDSAVYALTVTATSAKLVRLDAKKYQETTQQLLMLSADAGALNRQFPRFLILSNQFFQNYFDKLAVPKGRVIVSPDGVLVPLDLLSRSATRPDWLLTDYAFSYTYSARVLVKQGQQRSVTSKSFLGLAPVAFPGGQPTLSGSDASLKTVAEGYFSPTLLVGSAATKRAFLREIPRHRLVQLYAHAQADSTGTESNAEPLIFFADSTLRASELSAAGLLPTQLVVLSACQTGVGHATRGEGVFSLARSLASAGVPATVTTLWRVDDRATYRLTELFFEKLKEGLPKDQALQAAKLTFLKTATGPAQLPALWAGMVLVGDATPLESGLPLWAWAGGGAGLLLLGLVGWKWWKRVQGNKSRIYARL